MKVRLILWVPLLALASGCSSPSPINTMGADHTSYLSDEAPVPIGPLRGGIVRPPTPGGGIGSPESIGLGQSYSGRVVYRTSGSAAPGITVQLVEARNNGEPTDRVLGTTRADAAGHFKVAPTQANAARVALVAAAAEVSADTGGDRREEGYQIKTRYIPLGSLPSPDPAKPNTILIDRRARGRVAN